MTGLLFAGVVLLWGLTWFAIHLQIGGTPIGVAIFWRFALAAVLLGVGLAATGRLRRPERALWPWLAGLGVCLFSCNFLAIYDSETYLASGTASVVFSMATLLNALNQWVFFRQRPRPAVLAGGVCGIAGVALLLGGGQAVGGAMPLGVGLALLGTLLFSFGNMISRRIGSHALDLPNAIFYGMVSGAALLGALALVRGQSFALPRDPAWIGGLLYLSVCGSVLGFLAYLALARRIGADRAAYTTILSPVIALLVSTAFENTRWSPVMVLGLVLVLIGNVIAFAPRRRVLRAA